MPLPVGLTSALALVTLAAAPGAPPNWSTEQICQRIIRGAGVSVQSLEDCKRSQDDALAELRRKWASYPADLKERCTEEAGLNGQTSFVDLVECINLGIAATDSERSFGQPPGAGSPRRP